ncbi:hypothetical protein KI387_030165, partial [Taxus chinensis]
KWGFETQPNIQKSSIRYLKMSFEQHRPKMILISLNHLQKQSQLGRFNSTQINGSTTKFDKRPPIQNASSKESFRSSLTILIEGFRPQKLQQQNIVQNCRLQVNHACLQICRVSARSWMPFVADFV